MESPEENTAIEFEAAEKLILTREHIIFDGDHRQEADRYLSAVDVMIQRSMDSVTVSTSDYPNKINSFAIQIAMARLQDEFRNLLMMTSSTLSMTSIIESNADFKISGLEDEFHNILITHTNQTEIDALVNLNSSTRSSSVTESSAGFKTARESTEEGYLEYEVSCSTSHRSTNSVCEIDLIPLEGIYYLRTIAERMIAAGYLRECIEVYVSVRKPIMDGRFHWHGIDKLSVVDVQILEWGALEEKIRKWIQEAKRCVSIHFAIEKRLCDQIFEGEGLGTIARDTCFMETIKSSMTQLINFPQAICNTRQSPEKLFKILDLHDTLKDLLTDVEFGSNLLESVRVQAAEILSRLAKAARGILVEFVNKVQSDHSSTQVLGGKIHPLTRYVMDYIDLLSDYKQTIMDSVVLNPLMGSRISGNPTALEMYFPDPENQSPLALHILWIIGVLQFNLEGKSKFYKDASLSHIFLMNNLHYILQKVEGSPKLFKLIRNDYLRRNLIWKLRQEGTSYERSTWAKILYCLRDEGLYGEGMVSRTVLRERFKTFNSMFKRVHEVQSTWSVPDPQLREELRISIIEKLIPAYRPFLGRYRDHIETWYHPEMYIKYSAEDLEIAVFDFFEGRPISLSIGKKLSSF